MESLGGWELGGGGATAHINTTREPGTFPLPSRRDAVLVLGPGGGPTARFAGF